MSNSSALPTIGVVIPSYNRAWCLGRAIESVLAQTYTGVIELVVVDDGSTDDTRQVVSNWPEISYHYIANSGPAAARNIGIKQVSTDFVGFLDSDDLLFPDAYEVLVQAANDGSWDRVMGHVLPVDDNADSTGIKRTGAYLGSGIYKRCIFDTVGLFDESKRSWEDLDWMARATEAGYSNKIIDETTLKYCTHDSNMSADQHASKLGLLRVLRESLERRNG